MSQSVKDIHEEYREDLYDYALTKARELAEAIIELDFDSPTLFPGGIVPRVTWGQLFAAIYKEILQHQELEREESEEADSTNESLHLDLCRDGNLTGALVWIK